MVRIKLIGVILDFFSIAYVRPYISCSSFGPSVDLCRSNPSTRVSTHSGSRVLSFYSQTQSRRPESLFLTSLVPSVLSVSSLSQESLGSFSLAPFRPGMDWYLRQVTGKGSGPRYTLESLHFTWLRFRIYYWSRFRESCFMTLHFGNIEVNPDSTLSRVSLHSVYPLDSIILVSTFFN